MNCPNCGSPVTNEDRFCGRCGGPIASKPISNPSIGTPNQASMKPGPARTYIKGTQKIFGGSLMGFGGLVWLVFGLFALFINITIVIEALGWGFLGGVLAFFLFPITITFAPWYAFIAWGNPEPLIITYGGALLGIIIVVVGRAIQGDD